MDEQPADEWTFTYQRREVTVQARVVDTLLRHLGHAGVDVAEKIRAREESRCVRVNRWDLQALCVAAGLGLTSARSDPELAGGLNTFRHDLCPALD